MLNTARDTVAYDTESSATVMSIPQLRKTAHGTPVTVAYGDGIGPEIMGATLRILQAAGAHLNIKTIELGEKLYRKGLTAGIDHETWRTLRERRVLLKGPITTPQGGGLKSLNVTLRKSLGLYANVRPCISYAPYISARSPNMDVVIVRENEEDLYAGIEHRQTDEVFQSLKLVSRPGCERVVRYAFEFARANGRKKVSCFTKDNIMKMTDGLFHRVFNEIAQRYPDIGNEHLIVDNGAAKLAAYPERFDVVVSLNLYGDIISDIAAEVAGSVGLAGSANVGDHGAMFEAVHGSAPDLAGQNVANPSGLINAAVMMLEYIDQHEVADRVQKAWLRTLEDGVHTRDCHGTHGNRQCVGTTQFANAVIARLGQGPRCLRSVSPRIPELKHEPTCAASKINLEKEVVGVDVFLHWNAGDADTLAQYVRKLDLNGFALSMITNRGVKVWPNGLPETFCTDHWRCRFMVANGRSSTDHHQIVALLNNFANAGFDFIKIENLCTFNDEPGYSLGQGQ